MITGELDVSDLLSVSQAMEIIDSTPVEPRIVEVALADAQGMRLAEDIATDRDYPPFDKSLMDGFAVRSSDLQNLPAALRVIGEVSAGNLARGVVSSGETMAIMTGAPVPPGTDGVVPVEDVDAPLNVAAGAVIRVLKAAAPQRYISRRGSDVAAGVVVLHAGTRLEAAQLAVAATVGKATVKIYAPPRVAVLATGDEIIPVQQEPETAQIRNSNSPMLLALLKRLGCRVVDLGVAGDKPDLIRKALIKGLQFDALFVTGGMSMGRYDFVPRLLQELSVELKVTKLRIKPGKPFIFGISRRSDLKQAAVAVQGAGEGVSYVFGLPGNPVSGFACTHRLASRLIARMAGGPPEENWIVGRLVAPLPPNGPREFYQPVKLQPSDEGVQVIVLPYKGSADLFTLAQADGLMVRAENERPLAAGAIVRVMQI